METSGYHTIISNDLTEVYRPLSLKLQLAYGVGHVMNDVCASMWFTYLLVFFHLVLGFSSSQAGLILLIGQVADALATPFVGFHSDASDNFWFCRYGRRKTWHIIGSACVLASFPFIFNVCVGCEETPRSAQLVYYAAFVILFQLGWASVQISHLSLIPELSPNEHDRTRLTAVRYSCTVLSNILIYILTWWSLGLGGGAERPVGPEDAIRFRDVVFIGLSIGVVCTIIFHIGVKEPEQFGDAPGTARSRGFSILCTPQIYQCALAYMCTRLFVNLVQVFIPLYLHETLGLAAQTLALVPLAMYIGSLLMSFFVARTDRWLGRSITYVLGAVLGLAACIWLQLDHGTTYSHYLVYVVACMLGASGSIVLVTSLGVTADLIGRDTDSGALVYGLMSFTDKLANGLAVVAIQYYHNPKNIFYYRDVLTYVCGGTVIIGSLAVISVYSSLRDRRGYTAISEHEPLRNPNSAIINDS